MCTYINSSMFPQKNKTRPSEPIPAVKNFAVMFRQTFAVMLPQTCRDVSNFCHDTYRYFIFMILNFDDWQIKDVSVCKCPCVRVRVRVSVSVFLFLRVSVPISVSVSVRVFQTIYSPQLFRLRSETSNLYFIADLGSVRFLSPHQTKKNNLVQYFTVQTLPSVHRQLIFW